jgi:hypothetical protein
MSDNCSCLPLKLVTLWSLTYLRQFLDSPIGFAKRVPAALKWRLEERIEPSAARRRGTRRARANARSHADRTAAAHRGRSCSASRTRTCHF